MESILEKIITNLKDIVKIKLYNNTTDKKYITWRIVRENIYMYDCGENYATVFRINTYTELIEKIQENLTNNTLEVVIKYFDDRKDCFKLK